MSLGASVGFAVAYPVKVWMVARRPRTNSHRAEPLRGRAGNDSRLAAGARESWPFVGPRLHEPAAHADIFHRDAHELAAQAGQARKGTCMHCREIWLTVLALGFHTSWGPSFAAGTHGGDHDKGTGHGSIGEPGQAAHVTRTVTVDMTDDMRFHPAQITVKRGETVHFLVKNSGKVKHEMVLGTAQELKAHYAMMMKMPGMEHADPNQVVVDPGKQGEIIWRFTKARKVDFACLQPGHYDAGMKGLVTVAPGKPAAGKSAKAD